VKDEVPFIFTDILSDAPLFERPLILWLSSYQLVATFHQMT
jgi:hypothetical protein